MPIIIRCHSCGFVLGVIRREDIGHGFNMPSIDRILRQWGYRCPVCLSPLSRKPISWRVE